MSVTTRIIPITTHGLLGAPAADASRDLAAAVERILPRVPEPTASELRAALDAYAAKLSSTVRSGALELR